MYVNDDNITINKVPMGRENLKKSGMGFIFFKALKR